MAYYIKRYAKNLTHFDFSDNRFNPETNQELVFALSRNTSIKFLNLSDNALLAAQVQFNAEPETNGMLSDEQGHVLKYLSIHILRNTYL